MYLCDNNKPRSLVEQKKIQWAKEREELSKLTVPWGKHVKNYEKSTSRSRNHPKSPNENYYNQVENFPKSLPPIVPKQRNEKYPEYDRYEVEGDTSGYASESAKEGSPDHHPEKPDFQIWSNWHRSSESEVSSGRDERLKWGDRGLGVGHLWDPREINENSKAVDPPGWLQRGLRRDKEVLIVSNSPEQSDLDRPFTGESTLTNATSRTHLRGQNLPLEPGDVIERERRRQKALELQTAIKQQLEEKEQKRKQEREKRIRDELEEEDRIRKEQELERRRVEEEDRIIKEKKEKEKQRTEAMHEALLNAEKEAKEKKKNKKFTKMKNIEDSNHSLEGEKPEISKQQKVEHSPVHMPVITKPVSSTPDKITISVDENPPKLESSKYQESYDNNQFKAPDNMDGLALVLPSSFDNLQNMQFALLLPGTNLSETLPIPVSVGTDRSFITENRVLTPSCFRNRKNCRESSTQTDNELKVYTDKYAMRDESIGSLDRNRGRSRHGRNDKRFRSEDRSKENRGDRPKWGANRAPTRYMKQSEKDPVYQKRKLRQKTREIQLIYEDKNNNYSQSSDDSVPVTPEHKAYRKNRGQWHKNERMFSQNISVYQTEILPLEFDRQGRVYVKDTDYQDVQQSEKHYSRPKQRDCFKTPDIYTVERVLPKYRDAYGERNEHRKMTDREDDSERTDNEEVLEKLNSLHKGLMKKQRQWEDNGAHIRSTFPSV